MPKVVYTISSGMNITFKHQFAEISTDDLLDDWENATQEEREGAMFDPRLLEDLVWEAVEINAEVVE